MNLMESIYKRQSVRKYTDEKVDKTTLKEIEALGNSNPRLYKDISMFVHVVEYGRKSVKSFLIFTLENLMMNGLE